MSCGKKFDSGNCVCDILREIVDAQNDVIADCNTSCEQSINDLLGDTGGNGRDTVPVLLYCKGNCKPFKGFGARRDAINDVLASFYFRVKDVDDECCATLELLRDPNDNCDDPESPVKQFTGNLRATGICISVDLECFCHVTCLPAITALS
ncbi:CotY/CotZ family spore coat protein [Thalassobacillus sp. CUG 92003]|uniref:CotY/CotZ family spore coat protein n=1 Tax=Thalassobacillus sp. CUG 92003 TaxID=2736641 RepID=UPI0015E79A6B|nr:CotY/CotZ family spore coat protein [Thalassobacillus sp. CUG 92003]